MIDLTYNISPAIRSSLGKIDLLRNSILLLTSSPKYQLRVRWEMMISRAYWTFRIKGADTTKEHVVKILRNLQKKKSTVIENNIFSYKRAFEYLRNEWTAYNNPVSTLLEDRLGDFFGISHLSRSKEMELKQLLSYIYAGGDHPVVKAALCQFWHDQQRGGTHTDDAFIGRLLSYAFLFKHGYGLDGMVCLEEQWGTDTENYMYAHTSSVKDNNLTVWIEYYVKCCTSAFDKTYEQLKKNETVYSVPLGHFDLSERDNFILALLDDPQATLTNKMVQKYCKVSQITASRTLSRLGGLGLLFPHGKGRSVYYTKV